MPIGTVDYTSTTPWNDPYNAWPAYSQVSLSAVEFSLRTFTLVSFNPDTDAVAVVAHYEDAAGDYFLDYDATGGQYGNEVAWTVYNAQTSDVLYWKATLIRAIPAKVAGVADGWEAQYNEGLELYIQPVFTSLNPWEYRRRRLLEIC